MSTLELVLNMLAETTTTALLKEKSLQSFLITEKLQRKVEK